MKKIKKLILSFVLGFGALIAPMALNSAPISSVKFVHDNILALKELTVPISDGTNPLSPNSVKYLMIQIDKANLMLNGFSTDYATSEKAVSNVMTSDFAIKNINELIVKQVSFDVTVEAVSSFNFHMSAAGDFIIDWGDGNFETIKKTNITNTNYSHTYSNTANRTVRVFGMPAAYATGAVAAISFYNSANKTKIKTVSGTLGQVFKTLPDGTSPVFSNTFNGCTGLAVIPSGLFDGITGAPSNYMFYRTFYVCKGLTGAIPAGLFDGVSGAPASSMFDGTFGECSGLTGSIPTDLFAGITGAPASSMFEGTFGGCSKLAGAIPSDLFAGIKGAPASYMFSSTFSGCSGLSGSIPAGLFGTISGAPAILMFYDTFYGCSGLTGSIPAGLFGTISGAPAARMFYVTFTGCSGLSGAIPAGLFGEFTGVAADDMFNSTFSGCSGITSIDQGIWDLREVTDGSNIFYNTFNGCSNIISPTPTVYMSSDKKLWEHFTVYTGGETFRGMTKAADYATIPIRWK